VRNRTSYSSAVHNHYNRLIVRMPYLVIPSLTTMIAVCQRYHHNTNKRLSYTNQLVKTFTDSNITLHIDYVVTFKFLYIIALGVYKTRSGRCGSMVSSNINKCYSCRANSPFLLYPAVSLARHWVFLVAPSRSLFFQLPPSPRIFNLT
jgi:hypothetical protein